jgi:hypothetical protein
LPRSEAKQRIQDELAKLRREYGALLHHVRESWDGDRMDFSVATLGQTVTGHLVVADQAIHVEVELLSLFAMLAGTVKHRLLERGRKLLEGPRPS